MGSATDDGNQAITDELQLQAVSSGRGVDTGSAVRRWRPDGPSSGWISPIAKSTNSCLNFPGGTATARGQLDHLLKAADLPNVSLRVFPFGAGTHPGLNGSFNILSFAEPGAMDVVYVEAPFAQRWVEGGEGAAAYDELFEVITEHSLGEEESASLLRRLRREL